jgi:hypothetical protein
MNTHTLDQLSSAERFLLLMEDLGFKQHLRPAVLAAALELHERRLPHTDIVNEARNFFAERAVPIPHGIEELPSTWLRVLPRILWSTRKPSWMALPYCIGVLGIEEGILRIAYPQEQQVTGNQITQWDQLRIVVNLSLQPNLWRPLSVADERELWDKRPELRQELLAVA